MKVFINNKEYQSILSQSLTDVLKETGLISQRGIAVAVNNEIIPKNNWDQYQLNDSDKITIITATQGG